MIQIVAWLGTLWGRVALGAGVVVALVGLRAWDVSTQQAKGVQKERARVVKEATKTDAKAAAKRRAAESNPDGVLTQYYRD